MPASRDRRCVPWWVVVVVLLSPLRMAVRNQGPRLAGGGQYAQLARSVRPLASSASLSACGIAAVTVLDASPKERCAGVWARICELPPAVLSSTFFGHAKSLSPPTSRQHARASRGASQPPPPKDLEPRQSCLTICTSSSLHARKPPPACVPSAASLNEPVAYCDAVWPAYMLRATSNAVQLSNSHCPSSISHSPLMSSNAVALPRVSASKVLANVSCLGTHRPHAPVPG
jgi:hypothetical protein